LACRRRCVGLGRGAAGDRVGHLTWRFGLLYAGHAVIFLGKKFPHFQIASGKKKNQLFSYPNPPYQDDGLMKSTWQQRSGVMTFREASAP